MNPVNCGLISAVCAGLDPNEGTSFRRLAPMNACGIVKIVIKGLLFAGSESSIVL